MNVETAQANYNISLHDIHTRMGGKARGASGKLFETLTENLCESVGFVAKKNDYKRSKEVKGRTLTNLQVDRHIYNTKGVMFAAVECKAYIDSSMLKRAFMDFVSLSESPDVSKDCNFAIVAGQIAVSQETLGYYQSLFEQETGKCINTFILNATKNRREYRPIYERYCVSDFSLDSDEVKRFVNFLENKG